MNTESSEDYTYKFKFITIGSSGVGKTCLIKRYVEGSYSGDEEPTLLSDMHTKILNDVEGIKVKLILCDTAGSERFHAMTSSYVKGYVKT